MYFAKNRYAGCRQGECRGAQYLLLKSFVLPRVETNPLIFIFVGWILILTKEDKTRIKLIAVKLFFLRQ
jgi:hypothetical protein